MQHNPIMARRLYQDVLAQIRGLMDGGRSGRVTS